MTLGEKIDRALKQEQLTLTELAEAVDIYPAQLRELVYSSKNLNARIYLKKWILLSKALNVPVEYFADDDLDDEITQTLLTVKAIRMENESKSQTLRDWERHLDEEKKKKWRAK